MPGNDAPCVVLGPESAITIGDLSLDAPIVVKHVLKAQREEIRFDFFVAVVGSRRPGSAAPVLVLVLVIVVQKHHPTLAGGEHRTRANVKNAASAGTGQPSIW